MRTFPFLLLFLMLSVVIPVREAGADSGAVTLQELELEARQNNPDILMARKRSEAARMRTTAASAMPDPMVGYEVQNVGRPFESTVGQEEMSMRGIVVSQMIPFPGKLSMMGKAARKNAEAEEERSREAELQALSALRGAYYEYYLAFRTAEILEQTKELMKNFQRIAETRYATGQGLQQDVLRAQLEVTKMLDELVEQRQKQEALAGMINSLAGRDPRAPLGRPADRLATGYTVSLDDLAGRAQDHSPLLRRSQRMVEMNEAELTASRLEFLPDVTVTAGVFERGEMEDFWTASVMVTVPLWFWNKTAGVKAAAASLGSARHERDAARLMLLARVRDLHAMARASEHHLRLYDAGIIPQARMALQSATSNYQVGRIDFLMLLDSHALLLKYQIAYERELVNLNKTISMLRETAGEENGHD